MASLMLLVCAVFVFCLLAVENRASRSLSGALWIPTIWMVIAASRPVSAWFNATQYIGPSVDIGANSEAGNPIDFWTLTALGAVAGVILIHRRLDWPRIIRRHRWFFVLLSYMLVSALWSEIPLIALKRWVREAIAVEMALLVISEMEPCQALESVFRRSAYLLLPLSVVLIRYYPAFGRQYSRWSGVEMWTGVTQQKNELGRLCMVSVFLLLFALHKRWRTRPRLARNRQVWTDFCAIVIGIYLIIGSHSETSMTTLMVGIAVFLVMQQFKKVSQFTLQACVVCLLLFGIALPFSGGKSGAAFTSALGRNSTFTGRTEVWAAVIPAQAQRPLLGYGVDSFWTGARRQLYDIPNAHNGYLDVLLEFGEVGFVFFTIWLLSCARQLHRALRQHYGWASFAICLLLMILIYNSTESAINSLEAYPTAVILMAFFAVAQLRSNISSKKAVLLNLRVLTPLVEQMQNKSDLSWAKGHLK